jgi:hypothetical protein
MPIHINLLAEAQIAEDLRRRDPVKRAIFGGTLLVVLTVVVWFSFWLAGVSAKYDLSQTRQEIDGRTNEFQDVQANQKKISAAGDRLAALQQLSSARFLQGSFLNALQQLDLDGVQMSRIRIDQNCSSVPAVANKTVNNHLVLGHPATSTEKTVITLDVRDISASPGDQVNKFKQALASQPYFKDILTKTNGVQLNSLSPLQTGTDGKPFMLFTLECDLPEQTREQTR